MSSYRADPERIEHSASLRSRLCSAALRLALALYFFGCVVVIASRWLVTTELPRHADEIEEMVGSALGIEFSAKKAEVGFTLLNPVVTLTDVSLARLGGPVSLHLPKVQAELSWSSLWHLEPRFKTLIITEPKLDIRKLANGYDIAGFIIEASAGSSREARHAEFPFAAWLLGQGGILIEKATLSFRDETAADKRFFEIKDVTAVFRSELLDYRTSLSGRLVQGKLESALDLRGLIEKRFFSAADDPLTWKGDLYANFERINFARLLKSFGLGSYVHSGDGAARIWASFDSGRIYSASAHLGLSGVAAQLSPELNELSMDRLTGKFRYSETSSGDFEVRAQDLAFASGGADAFGPADLSGSCRRDASGKIVGCSFDASVLSLATLARIGSSLPIPERFLAVLSDRAVSGTLKGIRASFDGDFAELDDWRFSGYFIGLTLPAKNDGIPGFRNLSGSVSSSAPGRFTLELDSHYASLYFPGLFRTPQMNFSVLTGLIDAVSSPKLELTFSNITAVNNDGTVHAAGIWTNTGGAGTVDIAGTASKVNARAVHKYLPNVVGDSALDYVEAAVLGGVGENGRFVVKGKLDDFPWDGSDPNVAQFLIETDVSKGMLDFMPSYRKEKNSSKYAVAQEWPVINNISGHLKFEGNRMLITGRSGDSKKLRASAVTVEIASFAADPVMLTVKGTASGDFGDGLNYLRTAPFLRRALNESFDASSGSGSLTSVLDFAIPLTGSGDPHWSVRSTIDKADFEFLPNLPKLTGLSGEVTVSDKGISTSDPIKGTSAAGPVTISAKPGKTESTLTILGTAGREDFLRLASGTKLLPLLDGISGSAPYSATARIPLSGSDLSVEVESPLTDILLPLPAPLEKAAGRNVPLKVLYKASGSSQSLRVLAEPHLTLDLGWENDALKRGWIGVGLPLRNVPEGIEAGIKADRAEVDDWLDIWQAVEHAETPSAPSESKNNKGSTTKSSSVAQAALANLTKIEADVNSLFWNGEHFGSLLATVRQVPGVWHLRTQGDVASGQIEYLHGPGQPANGTLSVKLTRLNLPDIFADDAQSESAAQPQTSARASTDPTELPDVTLVIDDFSVGKRKVGKVELSAQTLTLPEENAKEWLVTDFTIRNPGGKITSQGSWKASAADPEGVTTVKLRGDISNAGKLLASLDIRDVIHDAPGSLSIDLSWLGSPEDFSLKTLSGSFSAASRAGQLLQVEPGAGRLLSLMSMQHLLQRLTLDFRDVFNRGFRFDSFRSDGTIKNGVVTLQKTTVSGSAATVVSQGTVDLVANQLDIKALVLPSLNGEAASLAVAIANPAIGIGTLVAQWLFKDQISNLLSSEYEVSGPIDNPKVSKIANLSAEHKPQTEEPTP